MDGPRLSGQMISGLNREGKANGVMKQQTEQFSTTSMFQFPVFAVSGL